MQAMGAVIPLDALDDAPRNPNQMEAERYELLRDAIRLRGFLQPILVTPRAGRFRIVDGHHRVRAARELGLTGVPAVQADLDDTTVDALQLGMNRNRGEINLTIAGAILRELEAAGWASAELTTTGFTLDEIDALVSDIVPPALDDAPVAEQCADVPAKPFILEIAFTSKAQYQLARRKLQKAAGKGNGLDVGLLNVLGETT